MRVMAYLFGAFVSFFAVLAAFGVTGFVGAGVIAGMAVFLISVHIIRGWKTVGYASETPENDAPDSRSALAYPVSEHGGAYFGGSGGGGFGGGCDGGGGGS